MKILKLARDSDMHGGISYANQVQVHLTGLPLNFDPAQLAEVHSKCYCTVKKYITQEIDRHFRTSLFALQLRDFRYSDIIQADLEQKVFTLSPKYQFFMDII